MLYELDGISPDIDPSAWIAPGCHLIGKIRIAAKASVWFGTTARGDNELITVGVGSRYGVSPNDWRKLHHRPQSHAAWLYHRRQQSDWYGRNRVERCSDW